MSNYWLDLAYTKKYPNISLEATKILISIGFTANQLKIIDTLESKPGTIKMMQQGDYWFQVYQSSWMSQNLFEEYLEMVQDMI